MKEFNITEDIPKSEIEFDLRFSNPNACYDYLFSLKWPNALSVRNVKTKVIGLVKDNSISVPNVSISIH